MTTFQAGGSLRPNAVYAEREADVELRQAIIAGGFCYILEPRQIGKSSLRARTASVLAITHECIHVDLSALGTEGVGEAECYFFLLCEAAGALLQGFDAVRYWSKFKKTLAPHARWRRFLAKELIPACSKPVVLFLDEIDCLFEVEIDRMRLFSMLWDLCAKVQTLSVCVMGAAAPRKLWLGSETGPFSKERGKRIRLYDLQRLQMAPFAEGLSKVAVNTTRILDAIFYWTEGHPYMTHRICEELAKGSLIEEGQEQNAVKNIVENWFRLPLNNEETGIDSNLHTAQIRLLSDDDRVALLDRYNRILAIKEFGPAGDDDVEWETLVLAGLVAERDTIDGRIRKVRNRIYATTLTTKWLAQRMQRL